MRSISNVLAPIYETVRRVKSALDAETTLIGFCGAPWTVATYMVAGEGTPDQAPARLFAYRDPDSFARLIDRLVQASIDYLVGQLKAGAEVVQIFDTWAGVLPPEQFERWCIAADAENRRLACARRLPGAKIIGFPRGAGAMASALCRDDRRRRRRARLDDSTAILRATRIQTRVPVQGNVDPLALLAGGAALDREVDRCHDASRATARSSSISATASCRKRRSRMSSGCSSGCGDDARCISGSKPSTSSPSSPGWPACSICRGCSSITAAAEPGSEQSETFKVMERRLLKCIIEAGDGRDLGARHRAGAGKASGSAAGWLHAKLVLVLAHVGPARPFCALGKRFRADRNRHTAEILSYYQ